MWELAGIVGVDPRRYGCGELLTMATAKQRQEWNQTAHVLAYIYNCRLASKRFTPADPIKLNPFVPKRRLVIPKARAHRALDNFFGTGTNGK